MQTNTLYQGDNLTVMRQAIPDRSVSLVYLDPPFGSNRNYKTSRENGNGIPVSFTDTWKWNAGSDTCLKEAGTYSPELATLLNGIINSIGKNPVTTYLVMMAPRLIQIHRILKETGSLYLHCDPTSSHYLKLVLDLIFGQEHFRNEIAWAYKGGGRSRTAFARKHDIILFYTKGDRWIFNYRDIMVDRTNRTWFTDEDGKRYWLKYGKRYYLKHEGKVPEDWWTDIDPLHGPYNERLGYPTQKPLALLDRIVAASSNQNDIVLDPFCGCGTTLVSAQNLGRKWIGIDISPDAVSITGERLTKTFPELKFETVTR